MVSICADLCITGYGGAGVYIPNESARCEWLGEGGSADAGHLPGSVSRSYPGADVRPALAPVGVKVRGMPKGRPRRLGYRWGKAGGAAPLNLLMPRYKNTPG